MKKLNKIATTLSIATSILLQACSSADSSSEIPAESNAKAPALNATWVSGCVVTSSGSTITQASGGGSGSVSGGNALTTIATFKSDGSATLSTEYFSSSNCNPNTSIKAEKFTPNYYIGGASTANDGSTVTDILYRTTASTTYSIFQIVNNSSLYIGNAGVSTDGQNGSSETLRHNGLGIELIKR